MKASISFLYLFLLIPLLFFLLHLTVSAHETGPSYVMINGRPTILNIVHAFAHNPGFTLATDLAPEESYLIGTSIQFAINKDNFFTPENIPAEFKWDFQDGTEAVYGDQTSHVFSSSGSHFINIFSRNNSQTTYSLIDTVQINIIPSEHYKIPVAKIAVDGKQIADFRSKNRIQPKTLIKFDGSQSIGNNLRYYWELGDGTRSRDRNVSHSYFATGDSTYFVILRVSDDQNMIHDSIITLNSTSILPEKESSNYFIGLFRYFSNIIARVIFRQDK